MWEQTNCNRRVKCGNSFKSNVRIYEHYMWKHEATNFVLSFIYILYIGYWCNLKNKMLVVF